MGGKGGTTIDYPDPIDIGKSISEYVGAVSDPVLRDQILGAERTDRPLFRALDLQDINTMASGIQAGQANPEYARIQSEIAALKAGGEAAGRLPSKEELEAEALEKFGPMPSGQRKNAGKIREIQNKIDAYVEDASSARVRDTARAEEIASLETRLANTPQTLEGTAGLFDLQDEASRRAGATTREALGLQREDDIRALETLGGRVVDAQRAADPSSTNLARLASERAGDFSAQERDLEKSLQDSKNENNAFRSVEKKLKAAGGKTNSAKFKDSLTDGEAYYLYQQGYISADRSPKKSFTQKSIQGDISRSSKVVTQRTKADEQGVAPRQPDSLSRLGDVGEGLLGSGVQAASEAERALQGRGMSDANARLQAASGAERAIQYRGLYDVNASREAATAGERALQAQGLSDLRSGREAASAAERAIQSRGLSDLNARLQSASAAENLLFRRGAADANAQLQAATSAERALQGRGMADVNARREAASQAERQLQQMGMTLGDLSPTEQEALISGRGSEFIQSTGELSPLEQRRAQQSARQGSLARGREMGQGSLYDEMLARQAEELNKEERQVALGSQLLGQEASMRGARLGQGAGMLQGSEALAAQRRAEQLQRQMFGSQNLGQVDDMAARRRQEQIQRQQFGTQTLGQTEALAAQRRLEQLQRQQFGTQSLGLADDMEARRIQQQLQRQQFGAQTVGQSEALDAQRRLEQLQRQQFGTQSLGLLEDMAARRRAEQLQRQQFGTSTLGLTEDMAARRRAEQLQRMQLGSGLIGQQEGLQAGRLNQAFNMNRSLSGDLGATILGRPSYATQLGSQTLGAAQQGAQQPVGPKLYDPNMGLNIAMQDQQNQFGLLGAQAQADAARSAGGLGAFGSILGGALTGGVIG